MLFFLTAPRCEEQCHDTKYHVCSLRFLRNKEIPSRYLSCNSAQEKKTFQGHLFCMTKLQPNYGHVGDMGRIFCGKMGMCVQQPWQSIGLWSVADRFLSTFSFILICAPSLSPSHAENEVSRLETAPQPTCQISLFSLPVPFLRQTLSLLQTRRKSLPLGICIPSP